MAPGTKRSAMHSTKRITGFDKTSKFSKPDGSEKIPGYVNDPRSPFSTPIKPGKPYTGA